MTEWIILTIPFAGTALGAAMVFLLKNGLGSRVKKLLLGFASGVMIAASVWSLLIPSIEMAEAQGKPAWLPALIGFMLGIGFLLVLDTVIPHLHLDGDKPEGGTGSLEKNYHDGICCYASQYSGRDVCGCGLCRGHDGGKRYQYHGSTGTGNWYCYPEFPRGGHRVYASLRRRDE